MILAIGVNGTIAATTLTFQGRDGDVVFNALVPPSSFKKGHNDVAIFEVFDDRQGLGLRTLDRIRSAATPYSEVVAASSTSLLGLRLDETKNGTLEIAALACPRSAAQEWSYICGPLEVNRNHVLDPGRKLAGWVDPVLQAGHADEIPDWAARPESRACQGPP